MADISGAANLSADDVARLASADASDLKPHV